MSPNVLVISHDVVGPHMSGPGIRYSQLARVLAARFDVTLAAPQHAPVVTAEGEARPGAALYRRLSYERLADRSIISAIGRADVVVAPALSVGALEPLLGDTPLAVDAYDPYVAEILAAQGSAPPDMIANVTAAALRGDFFMCANRRQRFWWLGWLEACGRLNEWTYRDDPLFSRLVALVPFGLPETPPQQVRRVIKGVWPEVAVTDKVILWGGGIWPWLDPETAIRAMGRVSRERPDLRLVFPGTRHPNPAMAGGNVHADAAKRLADELGLTGTAVVFGDWVPYEDWPNVLLDSDIGLTLHHPLLEAELAHRSRALDYLWAELPIVATEGDAIGELVAEHRLGRIVQYGDVDAVGEAFLALAAQPKAAWEPGFRSLKEKYTWPKAAEPLVAFCQSPSRSADALLPDDRRGNPYYLDRLMQAEQAIADVRDQLSGTTGRLAASQQALEAAQDLIMRYESGRFMRLMKRLHHIRERLSRPTSAA